MTRILSTAAILAAFVCTAPAFAADLIVDEAVAPAAAAAPTGFYATFFAGGSFASGDMTYSDTSIPVGITFQTDLDPGFIVGGALGMSVYQNLRGEIEFSYMQATVDDSDLPSGFPELTSTGYNLLGNLWYDFENDTDFTPYLGAGVGYGYNETGAEGENYESSGLLYQLGGGVKFDVADNIALDVGYRYRVLSDASVTMNGVEPPAGMDVKTNATNHIVQAGITFGF